MVNLTTKGRNSSVTSDTGPSLPADSSRGKKEGEEGGGRLLLFFLSYFLFPLLFISAKSLLAAYTEFETGASDLIVLWHLNVVVLFYTVRYSESIQSNRFNFFQDNHFNCSSGKFVTGGLWLSPLQYNERMTPFRSLLFLIN